MAKEKTAYVARVLVQSNDVLKKNTVSAAALKMRDVVHDNFTPFTIHFEGPTYWMYLDRKNLVTTGYGNLIDSTTDALGLPWEPLDSPGTAATPDQIVAEWKMVKSRTDMSPRGGGTFAAITTLRLTTAAVQAFVERRLATNDGILAKTFPDYVSWPADAQLGVLSMAWAMGAYFPAGHPKFTAAAKAADWSTAAEECFISEVNNEPIHPRNVANKQLFLNALNVAQNKLDPSVLIYTIASQ